MNPDVTGPGRADTRRRGGRNKITVALVGLVAAGLALSACAGQTNPTGDATQAGGGTLTLIQGSVPLSLDPAKSNAGQASQYVDLAYSNLIHWNGDAEFVPELAESFEFVGEGNTTFQIDLRDDVKFSDGTPLDAAAVKTYLEYFQTANGPFGATAANLIESIETPAADTVVVHFSAPNPDAPLAFAEGGFWGSIVNPSILADDPEALGTTTAGAGPYMLDTAATVTGSSYVYVKNPEYFDAASQKWDKVEVKVIANANSALQAVTTGKNTWAQGTWQQVDAAASAGLQVEDSVPNVYSLFLIDRDGELQPALGEEKVRQALNYAIDRDAFASLLNGAANQQIIAEGYPGYSEEAASVYTYDPDKATQLLAEAGYPEGFTFSVLVGTFDPYTSQVAQALADQFADVGVTMEISTAATFPDFAREQGTLQYSADVEAWGSTTMYGVAQQLVLPAGVVNPWHSSDDELNALYEKASGQVGDEALATWEQLSLAVTEKAWYVPVATVGSPFFATAGLNVLGDSAGYPNPLYF